MEIKKYINYYITEYRNKKIILKKKTNVFIINRTY